MIVKVVFYQTQLQVLYPVNCKNSEEIQYNVHCILFHCVTYNLQCKFYIVPKEGNFNNGWL